jgi:thiol-disulfide isomerase/thioredoxin
VARQSKASQRTRRREELERQRREAARKRAIRNGALTIGGALVVVLLIVVTWPRPTEAEQQAIATSNTTADAWDLPVLEGEGRIALADFRGKPTVAAFFAEWCTVCEREIPEFLALSENLGDRVNFVGINTQDNARGLGDARKWGIDQAWPLARDIGNGNASGLSAATFGARGMPMTVVYDAEGSVAHVQRGYFAPELLVNLLESLGV